VCCRVCDQSYLALATRLGEVRDGMEFCRFPGLLRSVNGFGAIDGISSARDDVKPHLHGIARHGHAADEQTHDGT
jgi:hypothetical protein